MYAKGIFRIFTLDPFVFIFTISVWVRSSVVLRSWTLNTIRIMWVRPLCTLWLFLVNVGRLCSKLSQTMSIHNMSKWCQHRWRGAARRGAIAAATGSHDRLYKALTDYTKPQQIIQNPQKTTQNPDRLYKAPERLYKLLNIRQTQTYSTNHSNF